MASLLPDGVEWEDLSAYQQGYINALEMYSYSSSEAWAENGVRYVGTTGTTLREAIRRFLSAAPQRPS